MPKNGLACAYQSMSFSIFVKAPQGYFQIDNGLKQCSDPTSQSHEEDKDIMNFLRCGNCAWFLGSARFDTFSGCDSLILAKTRWMPLAPLSKKCRHCFSALTYALLYPQ